MNRPHSLRRIAPALAVGALFSASAWAQTQLYVRNGDKANDKLGFSARAAGDVNGDGLPDFVVGAPENGNVLAAGQGFVRVYSGANGSTLYTWDGTTNNDEFGTSVDGAGDVNNDGRADIVIGSTFAGGNGTAYVRSGLTGAVLHTFTSPSSAMKIGRSVAGAGDVNNDGFADILTGNFSSTAGGSARGYVEVRSGQNGSLIRSHTGTNNQQIGVSLDGVGDVNNDGFRDYVIGSYFGGAKVYSGQNGAVLWTFTGLTDDRLGTSCAAAGDVNQDGVPDVIVGAPQDNNIFSPGNGYARVYSGANGTVLLTLNGSAAGDRFGISVGGAGDVNGDGRPDLVVGADQQASGGAGYVRVLSGFDGSVIHTLNGAVANSFFGASVDGLGNVDGVGNPEIILGVPSSTNGFTLNGRAEVWTVGGSVCPTPYTYCVGAPNTTGLGGAISYTGTTSIAANNLTMVCSQLPSNSLGLFYYGATEVQQVFGNGFRCVGGQVFRLPIRQTNASGVATLAINYSTLPSAGPITPSSTWKWQFWYRNPAAGGSLFNLSNALSITFCQ